MEELINLERLKASLEQDFDKTVKEIDEYLQNAVYNQEISELSQRELKKVIKEANGEISGILLAYGALLKANGRELFVHRYQVQMTQAHQITKRLPKEPKALLAYADKVFTKPLQITGKMGVSFDELLSKFSDDEAKKIANAIRLAHHESLPNSKLVQMIRGSRAKRYQDGILATTTRHAKTIAHTGTAIMASEAKQEFICQNKDMIDGVKVVATLDRRTSVICRGRDGMIMSLDKAVYPPYHYNCRTTTTIVYKGYKDPVKRSSEHGVVDNKSYYEWLKEQSDDYQNDVLGKTRAKLFRDGGLSVERFRALQLDKNFTPLTLDEMKKLEPNAFKQAGI